MCGLVSGELPLSPAALLLGARPIEAGKGTCTFSMPATGWLTSPTGLVLGGVTACPADFALGAAMHTTVPPGTAVAPTGLRVQFIRPAPGDGCQVTARATVVHRWAAAWPLPAPRLPTAKRGCWRWPMPRR